MSFILETDFPITRRGRQHVVRNEHKKPVFVAKTVGQCVEYLVENDIRRVLLHTTTGQWVLDIEPAMFEVDVAPTGA